MPYFFLDGFLIFAETPEDKKQKEIARKIKKALKDVKVNQEKTGG